MHDNPTGLFLCNFLNGLASSLFLLLSALTYSSAGISPWPTRVCKKIFKLRFTNILIFLQLYNWTCQWVTSTDCRAQILHISRHCLWHEHYREIHVSEYSSLDYSNCQFISCLFSLSTSQHACFSCPNEACAGGGGEENKYIRLHVAGASEATTISSGDFTCYHCGTQLAEDVSLRTLASKYKMPILAKATQKVNQYVICFKISWNFTWCPREPCVCQRVHYLLSFRVDTRLWVWWCVMSCVREWGWEGATLSLVYQCTSWLKVHNNPSSVLRLRYISRYCHVLYTACFELKCR